MSELSDFYKPTPDSILGKYARENEILKAENKNLANQLAECRAALDQSLRMRHRLVDFMANPEHYL